VIAPLIQFAANFCLAYFVFKPKGDKNAMKTGRLTVKFLLNLLPVTPVVITAFTVSIPFFIEVVAHNNDKLRALQNTALSPKNASGITQKTPSNTASQ
jgi:hypothetical protein